MSREWFSQLLNIELRSLTEKIKAFQSTIANEDEGRARDYRIYYACVETAFSNDLLNNREPQITSDEKSVLITLARQLCLSSEEVRLIESQILEIPTLNIDALIKTLKELGCVFYMKRNLNIYVPDEIVKILRSIKGKAIADKHFRRILKRLADSQLNRIAKMHNISKDLPKEQKIKAIIHQGIRFQEISKDMFGHKVNATERKKLLNEFIEKRLNIPLASKGVTFQDKIEKLIEHFNLLDADPKVMISLEGYKLLIKDLFKVYSKLETIVRDEFELQSSHVLSSDDLIDYNIKPRDILDLIPEADIKAICEQLGIKTRGDFVQNILNAYRKSENILIENYTLLANRDYKKLQENGVNIKETDIGLTFESVTEEIFRRLKLEVDQTLKKKVNTSRAKVDIIIKSSDQEVIVVECKTKKDAGYSKFSTVARQMKAYQALMERNGLRVVKSLIVANHFSDVFINECEWELSLNISLIQAHSLLKIYHAVKDVSYKNFPINLLMRDVVISEDRVIQAFHR